MRATGGMNSFFRQTRAEISKKSLINNFHLLRSLLDPEDFFCPMVKCNAYGHNAVSISKWLEQEGGLSLGVALLEEGIELRQNNVSQSDIYIFGPVYQEGVSAVVEHRLTPVITSIDEVKLFVSSLRKIKPNFCLDVHLKFDTGMNRLGLNLSHVPELLSLLRSIKELRVTGLCTHLLCGEDLHQTNSQTIQQLNQFKEIEKNFGNTPLKLHAWNSAALIEKSFLPQHNKFWRGIGARPGIALYGGGELTELLSPQASRWVKDHLKNVMSLKGELIHLREVKAGQTVSYNGKWKAQRNSVIGVIACGYGDGYRRSLSPQARVQIGNQLVPVVGNICMDYFMVDLTDLNSVSLPRVGDLVLLLGGSFDSGVTSVDWAHRLNTLSYEVMTGITSRVPRLEVD